MKNINLKVLIGFVAGFALALIWVVAVRFVSIKDNSVHYHANFAVLINGKAEEFKNPSFYEEVQACSGNEASNPRGRVHLHQPNNYVVHVHDDGVTWGAFFANLSFVLGDNVIKTDDGTFVDKSSGKRLTFILNGEKVTTAANRVIESEDVLLISYGDETAEEIHQQYDASKKDAGEFNEKYDPATCSGSKELTNTDKLKQAIGF